MNYRKYRTWCVITILVTIAAVVGVNILWAYLLPGTPFGSGIGGAIGGLGFAMAMSFARKGRNEDACRRINAEEKDERLKMINWRAGYVTLWVTLFLMLGMMLWLGTTEHMTAFWISAGVTIAPIILYTVLVSVFNKKM